MAQTIIEAPNTTAGDSDPFLGKVLTMAEIERHFDDQWVLLEDPKSSPVQEVLSGKLLFHSPEREKVMDEAMRLRPKRAAFLYIGEITDEMAFLL